MLKGKEMSSNNSMMDIASDATGKSKLVLLLMPLVLVVTAVLIIFQILTNSRGFHTGYLVSFVIY